MQAQQQPPGLCMEPDKLLSVTLGLLLAFATQEELSMFRPQRSAYHASCPIAVGFDCTWIQDRRLQWRGELLQDYCGFSSSKQNDQEAAD